MRRARRDFLPVRRAIAALLAVMLLAPVARVRAQPAGGPGGKTRRASATPAVSPAALKLEGTYWRLVELAGAPALSEGREAFLVLDPERTSLSGSTGCNRVFGRYELAGSSLRLTPGGMTRMGCPEPLMKQEDAYLRALRETTGYRIDGDRLELLGKKGVLARFDWRRPQASAPPH